MDAGMAASTAGIVTTDGSAIHIGAVKEYLKIMFSGGCPGFSTVAVLPFDLIEMGHHLPHLHALLQSKSQVIDSSKLTNGKGSDFSVWNGASMDDVVRKVHQFSVTTGLYNNYWEELAARRTGSGNSPSCCVLCVLLCL
jgi:hypothetical protein